jgi:hypothetical protein
MTLTDVCQGSKSNPRCDDILPLDLVVVKEPPNILVSNNITDVGPTNVEEGKEYESCKVATEWLQNVSLRARGRRGEIYLLALNTAEEEDLKESNGSTYGIFVENEEGCVPAMSESVVTCEG